MSTEIEKKSLYFIYQKQIWIHTSTRMNVLTRVKRWSKENISNENEYGFSLVGLIKVNYFCIKFFFGQGNFSIGNLHTMRIKDFEHMPIKIYANWPKNLLKILFKTQYVVPVSWEAFIEGSWCTLFFQFHLHERRSY